MCTSLQGGEGVCLLIQCKEERMSTLHTPSCASFSPPNGASLSSILRICCILHCKDEEYDVHITPSQWGDEEYTTYSYFSCPPCDGVRGLLFVQMGTRSRMATPLWGGEEVLCLLLVVGIRGCGYKGLAHTRWWMMLDGAIVIRKGVDNFSTDSFR